MNAQTLSALAARTAEVLECEGGEILSVQFGEMGDGSRRHFALATVYSCGQEQEYRVTTPAPADAPPWTFAAMSDWAAEVRDGERWLHLGVSHLLDRDRDLENGPDAGAARDLYEQYEEAARIRRSRTRHQDAADLSA